MFDHNETLEQARQRNISDALTEDIGICDWTAKLVPNRKVHAQLLVRQQAVLCGVAVSYTHLTLPTIYSV